MENKIPPSEIMRECFGPDSDEDPAVVDACAASAAGDGVGQQVTDENENVVGKDGDNVSLANHQPLASDLFKISHFRSRHGRPLLRAGPRGGSRRTAPTRAPAASPPRAAEARAPHRPAPGQRRARGVAGKTRTVEVARGSRRLPSRRDPRPRSPRRTRRRRRRRRRRRNLFRL